MTTSTSRRLPRFYRSYFTSRPHALNTVSLLAMVCLAYSDHAAKARTPTKCIQQDTNSVADILVSDWATAHRPTGPKSIQYHCCQ